MTLEAIRSSILRRRGLLVAGTIVICGGVAGFLAVGVIGQARELTAGGGPSPTASPPAIDLPVSHHDHQPEPVASSATPAPTADPTPVPTPAATPEPDAPWMQTAAFGDGTWSSGVMDVEVWEGTFVAVGTTWTEGNPQPRMWRSSDGRAWAESALELGPGVSLEVVAPLPDGRLMVLGTVGGDVEYWSAPERAAAWLSADGVTWTAVALPFRTEAPLYPVDFTAGDRGLLATTGDAIWHSPDGSAWDLVYDAPRGTMVYAPVAGDEGWIVRSANVSLSTTTLLVSGDATTWDEVDLGNVATVANVAGDWMASRSTEDWTGTEILRSANGLDWSVVLDLDDLAAPGDSETIGSAGAGGGAALSGTHEVLMLSPWRSGHCVGMPSGGWGAWWSIDGTAWSPTGLGGDAVVTHTVGIDGITVLAGYTANNGDVAFWVSRH